MNEDKFKEYDEAFHVLNSKVWMDFDFSVDLIAGNLVARCQVDDRVLIDQQHIPLDVWWRDIRTKMANEIYRRIAASGEHVTVKLWEKCYPCDDFCKHTFEVVAELTAVQYKNVIMTRPALEALGINGTKKPCPACGSVSPDDSRGNCSACGSPREAPKDP